MRGPFFISLGLHAAVAVAMVWATGARDMVRKPLPAATTVKLVRPRAPIPAGSPQPSRESELADTKPVMEFPTQKKKPEPKTEAKPVPAPKKEQEPARKPTGRTRKTDPGSALGAGGKELVSDIGTLRLSGGGFEYDFYLAVVQSKIEQNFRPPPGVRGSTLATVAFTIEKNGSLTGIALAKSSGNLLIDQAAERSVRAAGRFPPLPPQYERGQLDIYFEFVVNPAAGQ